MVLSTSGLSNACYKIVCAISTLMICGSICDTGATSFRSTQLSETSNLGTKTTWPKGAMSAHTIFLCLCQATKSMMLVN
jgi:hypothetical protein